MSDYGEFIHKITRRYGSEAEDVIPLLQEIQKEFGYLPQEALEVLSATTEITPAAIESVASFYSQFRFEPAGRHIIRVCAGTACHVKGAGNVYDAFARELKLGEGENTSADGLYTLEQVACLGCCTLAPVVKIDEVTYGHVKPGDTAGILKEHLHLAAAVPAETNGGPIDLHDRQGEIRLGLGSCCQASGSAGVKRALDETLAEHMLTVEVKQVGCVGACNQVPLMEILKPGEAPVFYAGIRAEEVRQVVLDHFRPKGKMDRIRFGIDRMLERWSGGQPRPQYNRYGAHERDTPLDAFLGPQVSVATEMRGELSPLDLDAYRLSGGFEALEESLLNDRRDHIIDVITRSGLRGRGGAGFPTGKKWKLVKDQPPGKRYVICNGDEGDPGAFMDRMLIESYPFRIIEGMLIAAFAVGASEGYLYIRDEYPLAVERMEKALQICRDNNLVGRKVLGFGFNFYLQVFRGAGAFVCGEETALIASMEGRRGTPRLRPPYPAVNGLRGLPTLINNTETFAMVPWILRNGAEAFAALGTERSKGTKVFSLAGKVKRGGLIEVPMGITFRKIVEEIGGGVAGGGTFKGVQIGGPSGGCIPASMAGMPVDYEGLAEAGAMMGSGGLIVLDDRDCMVDLAWYFLSFTQGQSCGQCTFCRNGTRRMLDLLEKIRSGRGAAEDINHLETLAKSVKTGSLCGLGKTAPNPVLTSLRYFREEYEAHIRGRCPAGRCTALIRYEVQDNCIGCTICARECPAGSIPFEPYRKHTIDNTTCIRCDICRQACPENAIKTVSP